MVFSHFSFALLLAAATSVEMGIVNKSHKPKHCRFFGGFFIASTIAIYGGFFTVSKSAIFKDFGHTRGFRLPAGFAASASGGNIETQVVVTPSAAR